MKRKIAVIGGGMAGTAAAHALTTLGYQVTIYEQNNYIGGRVHSHLVNGTAVEMGAGFQTRIYTNLRAFLALNNLDDRLYKQSGQAGFVVDGKVVIASLSTLLRGKLLSSGEVLQLAKLVTKTFGSWNRLDPHQFSKAQKYDTRTISDCFPHDKQGLLEKVLQPMLDGYFYWTPDHTSEAVLLVLTKSAILQGSTYRMSGGLQQIPESAARECTVLLNAAVKQVQSSGRKYAVQYQSSSRLTESTYDGIVCATTASVVPKIFSLSRAQSEFFSSVAYSSTTVLTQTYKQQDARSATSIAFPRSEGSELAAITLSPEKHLATVKIYTSGRAGKEFCALTEPELERRMMTSAQPIASSLLSSGAEPIASHLQKWPEALPYFDVGHIGRLRAFDRGDIEPADESIVFAGDYLGGPYMEGAFTSGLEAASRLDTKLKWRE